MPPLKPWQMVPLPAPTSPSSKSSQAFSTATRVRYDEQEVCTREVIPEGQIDRAFRAIAECAEEAVLDSMVCAHEMTGYQDHHVFGLSDWLDKEEIAQLLK